MSKRQDTTLYTMFYKVFNSANYYNGYEYDDGLNDLSNYIGTNKKPLECTFVSVHDIFCYVDSGPCYRQIIIPDEMPVLFSTPVQYGDDIIPRFISNKVILGDIKLWTVDNIKNLIKEGADISIANYKLVKWSLLYNFQIFYFLQDYISSLDENLWSCIIQDLESRGFL